jgi:putative nucleotidyltransferase with HDIG domain
MRPTATESGVGWIAAPVARFRPRDALQLTDELERLHPLIRAHSRAVAVIAGRLARTLGGDGADEATVRLAGSFHDVGKVTIPRTILGKPGALTRSEWELVRRHPVEGARLLRPVFGDRPTVLAAVRWHHERWDGLGYPDGLPGTRAPLAARIVAAADAFQAMLEARPYRRQRSVDHALDELEAHAGTQFDPQCVSALRDTLRS